MEPRIIDEVNQLKTLVSRLEQTAIRLNGCLSQDVERSVVQELKRQVDAICKDIRKKSYQVDAAASGVYLQWFAAYDTRCLYGVC